MYEKVGNDYELFYRYDNDGKLSVIVRYNFSNSTNYYYNIVTNTQGDVVEILSGSGSVLVEYTYDAWGNIVSIKNGSGTEITSSSNIGLQNSIRYRGYVYDNETGLYYLQSRYYDPEVGRFINCDSPDYIGLNDTFTGWNGFAYCENDPMNGLDENGFLSSIVVARIILNVAGYIFAWAYTKYKIRKDYRWRYTDMLDLIAAIASGLVSAFIGRYVTGAVRRFAVAIGVGVRFYVYSMIWNGPPKNLNQVWKSTKEVIFNALF